MPPPQGLHTVRGWHEAYANFFRVDLPRIKQAMLQEHKREHLDELIVAQIDMPTLKEPITRIWIEPELLEWALFAAKTAIPRYGASHWSFNEWENNFFGYLGQKTFESVLLELKIHPLHADPFYKDFARYRSIEGKGYDFHIRTVGTIEVKTTPPDQTLVGGPLKPKTRFMANVERWRDYGGCNFAVAIKIVQGAILRYVLDQNNKPTDLEVAPGEERPEAWIYGYLDRDEVEKLPIKNFGYGDAFWTFLDPKDCEKWNRNKEEKVLPLHPASDLMRKFAWEWRETHLKDLE